MSDELLPRRDFDPGEGRMVPLEDATIRADGSGRVVEAYTAVFDQPAEIHDSDGHYIETIDRAAFDSTIAQRGLGFAVLYNHGRGLDGRPAGLPFPIGKPLEVRADERGVFTATEYLDTPDGNNVLAAVKARAVGGYSFSGAFLKSRRSRSGGSLPRIHRTEVSMREFGPVLFPAYAGAQIVGTRSLTEWTIALEQLDIESRGVFLRAISSLVDLAHPIDEPVEDPAPSQSARRRIAWNTFRASLIEKGITRHE